MAVITEEKREEETISASNDSYARRIIRRLAALNSKKMRVTVISLAVLGVLTGVVSLLLASSIYGLPMFVSYFASLRVILLNVIPPLILIFLVYCISGRASIAFGVVSFAVLFAAGVDLFKIQIRGDPLMAEDILHIAEARLVLAEYTMKFDVKILVAVLFLLVGEAWTIIVCGYRLRGAIRRIGGAAIAVALSATMMFTVYLNNDVYNSVSGGYDFGTGTINESYITRGFIYPFLHSFRATTVLPPPEYVQKEAEEILQEYTDVDLPSGAKVNVISIMLEAYMDLSIYDIPEFTTDVYEKWHALEAEGVSGTLIPNIFGGGTIDTERLFLTGYLELFNIKDYTESYLHYFRDQGYYIEGLHTGTSDFYSRNEAHVFLGFDDYKFLDDYTDSNRTDTFFFEKLREQYDSRDKSVPYFNHSLTYQNHGGYISTYSVGPHLIEQGELSEEVFFILNNYLTGIYDTNERIYEFVTSYRDDPEPVVFVMYGDHKPWLGNADIGYGELGIDIDPSSVEGFHNYYSTPYIFWANDAAKAVLGAEFSGDGGDVSPSMLMNKLFELCSWTGDAYMQLTTELYKRVPVVNTATGYFLENGVYTKTLTPESQQILDRVRSAAYLRQTVFRHEKAEPGKKFGSGLTAEEYAEELARLERAKSSLPSPTTTPPSAELPPTETEAIGSFSYSSSMVTSPSPSPEIAEETDYDEER